VGATGAAGATGASGATGATGATGTTGAGYFATSSSSNAIGTGSKTFTTQAGLAYSAGAYVQVTDQSTSTNYMQGTVTSYSGTTLVVNVTATSGSGTPTIWYINLAGVTGAAGTNGTNGTNGTTGATGATGATGPGVSGLTTIGYALLTETSSAASLSNTLNVGSPTVTRVAAGEVCVSGLATTFANVQASAGTQFSGQPTDVVAGIVGQSGETSPFTCTGTGSVWVEMNSGGHATDTLNVYLLFTK
jgi:hypothetical protein